MGHTKPEIIADLSKELDIIRKLPELKEKSFGVFYFKSNPFLHFHHKEDKRWADVKTIEKNWISVEVGFECSPTEKKKFLKKILQLHNSIYSAKTKKSPKK